MGLGPFHPEEDQPLVSKLLGFPQGVSVHRPCMHHVIGGQDRDLRRSGRLLNLAEPVIDRRKGILSFRLRENPAAASDHPGLVPCDELLVGIGDNNNLLR